MKNRPFQNLFYVLGYLAQNRLYLEYISGVFNLILILLDNIGLVSLSIQVILMFNHLFVPNNSDLID